MPRTAVDAEGHFVQEAIAETEQEIFDSAFDNAPDDNDGDMSLEATEGWDSDDPSDEEQWETTLNGHDDNYPDGRPLEGRDRDSLAAENQQLRQRLTERESQLDQVLNGPERQEQMRQELRERLFNQYGVLATDDRVDALLRDMGQQHTALQLAQNDRVNQSMARAHAEYGADFEHAYDSLESVGDNPTGQALIRDVMSSPDPGERLMALASGASGIGNTRGLHLPSLNSMQPDGGRGGLPRGGRGRDLAQEDNMFGKEEIRDRHLLEWARSNRDFLIVNRSPHPGD